MREREREKVQLVNRTGVESGDPSGRETVLQAALVQSATSKEALS